jgi:hypothetical protein
MGRKRDKAERGLQADFFTPSHKKVFEEKHVILRNKPYEGYPL